MSLDLLIIKRRSEDEILEEIRGIHESGNICRSVNVDECVWEENITHNLTKMAENCPVSDNKNLHDLLWHPGEHGFGTVNSEYIELLNKGLEFVKTHKSELEKYNPSNGWGTYDGFLDFVNSLVFFLNNLRDYENNNYLIMAYV